jgi:energy-coupling factor transport system substrate-specific component
MSWQLASLSLVVVALAACFWWYERSRPSSKEVALVATMAALSALGRDAFAALPDVKPTTAMVFICGYAFGPGPGFAVGAVGALASNIFLGQGSWTPWQMLAWGVVGLGGAALGRLLARRPIGRLGLAFACALAAEAFNLLINFYTWTQGGAHTLAAYGAWLLSAVSFDATHVVASFVFAFAFGPALLRMLTRARARLEIVWDPLPGASALIAVGVLVVVAGLLAGHGIAPAGAAPAGAPPTGAAATPAGAASAGAVSADAASAAPAAAAARVDIARELAYLARAQNTDGGFGAAPGQTSSELYTAWVAIGVAAAGRSPSSMSRDGHSVLYALRREAPSLHGGGDLERTILALHACGASTRSLPGGNPVARLLHYRSRDGSFGHLSNLTAFAILALRAAGYSAGNPTVHSAARWLVRQQEGDGGFGFGARGGGSDVDDTAAVVQALGQAGVRERPTLAHASSFLVRAQNLDGGYPQEKGGLSNAQSSSWAVQALVAGGRDPAAVKRAGSRSPLGYLESLVAADGSVRYSRTGAQTPVWVTAQALTALAGRPFPISSSARAASGSRRSSESLATHSHRRRANGRHASADTATTQAQASPRHVNAAAHALGVLLGAALAPTVR